MSRIDRLLEFATQPCRRETFAQTVDALQSAIGRAASSVLGDMTMDAEEIDADCLADPTVQRCAVQLEQQIAANRGREVPASI